jgi:hypothetical protein
VEIVIPYSPMPHQAQLHNCRSKQIVVVTGRQVGKTVCAVNELIKRAILTPRSRNWYVTNDYKQAKRNVWDLFLYYLPKSSKAKFNSSELSIHLPNGSRIELVGVENAESLRGAAVHFMILDEYADFPRDIWPKVLKPMFSTTAGDVWFMGTPKGIGNDLYDKWNDQASTCFKFPSAVMDGDRVADTLSSYASISELQDAKDKLPKDAFAQEYLAEFTRPAGVVYSNWPLENFTRVEYDPSLPVHVSMDFGVNDPTAIIWIQPGYGEFRVIDYYEKSDSNVAHFASVIKSKPYKLPELFTGDDAGRGRSIVTGTSPIDEYAKHDIYIRTMPGLKIPDQIRRTSEHIRSLYVSKKLTRFRDCLLNYRYPEIKTGIDQSNEKPIHDEFSHSMRALEYYFVNAAGMRKMEARRIDTSKWSLS